MKIEKRDCESRYTKRLNVNTHLSRAYLPTNRKKEGQKRNQTVKLVEEGEEEEEEEELTPAGTAPLKSSTQNSQLFTQQDLHRRCYP